MIITFGIENLQSVVRGRESDQTRQAPGGVFDIVRVFACYYSNLSGFHIFVKGKLKKSNKQVLRGILWSIV